MSMSYASHLFSNNSSVCDGDDEFLPHSVNFPTDQTYTLSAQGAQLVDLFTVKREKFEEQFDYLLHCPHEISPCASQSASQQQPSSLSYEENDISESNSNISETKLNVKETDKSTHSFPLTTTTTHVVIKQEPTDDDDIASQLLPPPTPFEPEFVKSAFVAMKQKKIANDVDDIKVPLKSQEKRLNREDLIDLHVKATLEKYCSKIASLEQCRFVVKIARRNRLSGKRSSMYDEAIADIVRSRLFEKDLIRISNDHLFDVVGMPLQEKFEQFKSSIVYIKKIQPLLVVVALLLNSRESFEGKRMLPSTKSDGDCLKALVKNGTEKAFKMHRDGQVTFRGESWRAKTIKRPKLARLLSQPLHDTDIVYHFDAVKKPAKKATKKVDEDDGDEEYVGNKTDSARQHNTRTTKRRYRKRTHDDDDDDDYKGKPVPTVAVATRATRKRRCVTAAAKK